MENKKELIKELAKLIFSIAELIVIVIGLYLLLKGR